MNYHPGKCRTDSTRLKFVIDYYTDRLLKNRANSQNIKTVDGEDGGDGEDRVHVRSNDFSRCSRVMASAITRAI